MPRISLSARARPRRPHRLAATPAPRMRSPASPAGTAALPRILSGAGRPLPSPRSVLGDICSPPTSSHRHLRSPSIPRSPRAPLAQSLSFRPIICCLSPERSKSDRSRGAAFCPLASLPIATAGICRFAWRLILLLTLRLPRPSGGANAHAHLPARGGGRSAAIGTCPRDARRGAPLASWPRDRDDRPGFGIEAIGSSPDSAEPFGPSPWRPCLTASAPRPTSPP